MNGMSPIGSLALSSYLLWKDTLFIQVLKWFGTSTFRSVPTSKADNEIKKGGLRINYTRKT